MTTKQSTADGTRWITNARYGSDAMIPDPDRPGWSTIDQSKAESYGVVDKMDWDIQHGEYASKEEAGAVADELNRLDVQGPLDPAFTDRRNRLKELEPYFGSWAHEGPPEARWPVRPKRYLIQTQGKGWHPEDWAYLVDDRAGIVEQIEDEEHYIYRIIDLDTGAEVPFTREIAISVDMPEDPT